MAGNTQTWGGWLKSFVVRDSPEQDEDEGEEESEEESK